jgi:hypothetical protein
VDIDKGSRKTGAVGWVILALYIVVFDVYAIRTKKFETLTRAYWRGSSSVKGSFFVHGLWALATFHLVAEHRVRRALYKKR